MPTLAELRHKLSARYGGYQSYTTGINITEEGTYAAMASGTDASRRVVSSDLADRDLAGTGTNSSATYFDDSWVFIPDTREQRRVVRNGYSPNNLASDVTTATVGSAAGLRRVGYLTLNRVLQSTLQAGTIFEAHRWPVKDDDRKKGLHAAINEALGLLFERDRLSLTGLGTTQSRYSLAAYPWIKDEGQLVDTLSQEVIAGLDPMTLPGGGMIRMDGNTPYLITGSGVASGTVFSIDVMRPLSSWIAVGGTWGESTAGLQDDSDQCGGMDSRIVAVADYLISRAMADMDPEGETGRWGRRALRLGVTVGPWLRNQYMIEGHGAPNRSVATVAQMPDGTYREVGIGGYRSRGWP